MGALAVGENLFGSKYNFATGCSKECTDSLTNASRGLCAIVPEKSIPYWYAIRRALRAVRVYNMCMHFF